MQAFYLRLRVHADVFDFVVAAAVGCLQRIAAGVAARALAHAQPGFLGAEQVIIGAVESHKVIPGKVS